MNDYAEGTLGEFEDLAAYAVDVVDKWEKTRLNQEATFKVMRGGRAYEVLVTFTVHQK